MDVYQKTNKQREALISVMKQGGYYERIMDSGPELNRVKQFLNILNKTEDFCEAKPFQWPTYLPVFPGLNASAFRSREGDFIAGYLENSLEIIKQEALSIKDQCLQNTKGQSQMIWRVYPLWYMGTELTHLLEKIPNIRKIAKNLPHSAQLFPFAESMISWLEPSAHLKAHSSTDGLRMRYSLGVVIEDEAHLRVGDIKKKWTAGECLIFEDCFEHEAWNGKKDRAVFIIDAWHPDLTPIEIEALLAGFRKSEIRQILFHYRSIDTLKNLMFYQFKKEDSLLTSRYWNKDLKIEVPVLSDLEDWSHTPRFKTAKEIQTESGI